VCVTAGTLYSTGKIPQNFGWLTDLKYLNLFGNKLEGEWIRGASLFIVSTYISQGASGGKTAFRFEKPLKMSLVNTHYKLAANSSNSAHHGADCP